MTREKKTIQLVILNLIPGKYDSTNGEYVMTLFHSRFGFLSLIGTNFISPIVEEFAFRGIFQERLKICGNHLLSVFISAAIFAFVHVFGIDKLYVKD